MALANVPPLTVTGPIPEVYFFVDSFLFRNYNVDAYFSWSYLYFSLLYKFLLFVYTNIPALTIPISFSYLPHSFCVDGQFVVCSSPGCFVLYIMVPTRVYHIINVDFQI